MNQTTLTNNAPLTLDTTCSELKKWPRFALIRMDIRRAARPDVVASAAALPFREKLFQKIYCDPPYMTRERKRDLGHTDKGFITRMNRMGYWKTKAAWKGFLQNINQEFARCLMHDGAVYFKIMDTKQDAKSSDLKLMDNFTRRPVKWWKSKAAHWRGNRGALVFVIEMRLKPENPEPSEPSALDTSLHSNHEAYRQTRISDTSNQ